MKITGFSSRIAVFNRPFASAGRRGDGDEQAGDVQEHRLQAVRVRRAELVPGALGHADHQRDRAWPPNM